MTKPIKPIEPALEKPDYGQDLREKLELVRDALENNKSAVNHLHSHPFLSLNVSTDETSTGAMHSNLTLAFRHLEDAIHRLQKAMKDQDHYIPVAEYLKMPGVSDEIGDSDPEVIAESEYQRN